MDPIHIHHLISQLSHEVRCPHCNAKVRPDTISVENSQQNFCFLRISCYACGETFHGHAHVGMKIFPAESSNALNTSGTLKASETFPIDRISETDISQVQSLLSTPDPQLSQFFSRNS